MDNKKELLHTIDKQKDEIARYKTRLRDVITAYKGLVTEKEAVEASLKAISIGGTQSSSDFAAKDENFGNDDKRVNKDMGQESETSIHSGETEDSLRNQLATLLNSMATVSAEKSRMEASFQADKKQLRIEKEEREKKIRDLHDRLQNMTKQRLTDVETIKSKLIVERHEREKEQNDHGIMIRELQKLLSEDRRAKENLESQLDEMKSKLSILDGQSGQNEQYERKLRDLRNELESTRRKLKRSESKANETPPLLVELQNEMAQMRIQHQAAIREEQNRAAQAEDRAKKLAAIHETRVTNLEGSLAELSNTFVGYDRLRQQDLDSIKKLKDHIAQLDLEQSIQPRSNTSDISPLGELKGKSESDLNYDVHAILNKIIYLKGQLAIANDRSEKPIDIMAALTSDDCFADIHRCCQEEYQQLEHKFELFKLKTLTQQPNNLQQTDDKSAVLITKLQAMKEKNRILNAQLDDTEREFQCKLEVSDNTAKADRARYTDQLSIQETDYKRQILLLELELKKQRERSIVLLEEKDHEIQTLKSTFQMFIPGHSSKSSSSVELMVGGLSDDVMSSFSQLGNGPMNAGGSPHMLHYAHELSRRDVDISTLRKEKYSLECSLRELQRETSRNEEKLKLRIKSLQNEVGRFERCQSRESANLEYLKNVVLSFLLSKSADSKQHMLNAITTVLKFSPDEQKKVNQSVVSASGMS